MSIKGLITVGLSYCLIVTSCDNKEKVTIYVTNVSQYTDSTELSILINDSLYLKQQFKYSDIVPKYDVFEYKLPKGKYGIKIVEARYGTQKLDSLTIPKDKYVFISFNEHKKNLPANDTIKRGIYILKREKPTKLY